MKTILITGGSSGIGYELVKQYLLAGWRVINLDKHSPEEVIKGEYHFVHGDLNEIDRLESVFKTCKSHTKQIDVLIHNAAFQCQDTFLSLDTEKLDEAYRVNIKAPLLLSQWYAKQYLGRHGRIVHILSTRAYMSEKDTIQYTMSKGAMQALVHGLAVTLADKSITVNGIAPGWIAHPHERVRDKDHQFHPSKRVGKAIDIAKACMYITDQDNQFLNGETIVVDGGVTKKMMYPE